MKKVFLIYLLIVLFSIHGMAQRKIFNLPEIEGYVTLKCDLHLHTVFSDGNVWPTVRVDEAIRDGLDAISITDHLEYTPKKDFIPVDHNGAWKVTENYAKERNLILVHGTEITRSMPPGHINALFITDANALATDSVWDAFEAAIQQGAFLLWNHPGWKRQEPDGIPKYYDVHRQLIKKGWLHGIEVFNHSEYYPLALDMCKEHKLAVLANTDSHGYITDDGQGHRPMNLVFAKERSHDSLKEALFAGRTLVWFQDTIAGKAEFAAPFFYAGITVGKPYLSNDKNTWLEVTNHTDIPFFLTEGPAGAPASITLSANSATRMNIGKNAPSSLVYKVSNIRTGEKEVLTVRLSY